MRISRHQMFMEIAHVVAKRSTCFRESVGCVIANGAWVKAIGYNGAYSGQPHCEHHPQGKCENSIHAEANALSRLQQAGALDKSCDLYVTHLPCLNCTYKIISSQKIQRVFFHTTYGDPENIYKILDEEGIQLFRILPSGTITDWNREEILNVEA